MTAAAWDPGRQVGAEWGHWCLESLLQTKVTPLERVVWVRRAGWSVFIRKKGEDKRLVITPQQAVHKRGGSLWEALHGGGGVAPSATDEIRVRLSRFSTTAPGEDWSTDKAAPASRSLYIVPFFMDLSVNQSVCTDVQKVPRTGDHLQS